MQLHYTDAAHVGRSRVMESLRFADCSECRAVSKAESTEQRSAEAAHIYRTSNSARSAAKITDTS